MKQVLIILLLSLLLTTKVTTKCCSEIDSKNQLLYPSLTGKIDYFSSNFDVNGEIDNIIKNIQLNSCLEFRKRNKSVKNKIGINFFSRDGKTEVKISRSKFKPTQIYLNKEIFKSRKRLSFYVGRALGLIPEVLREDRDRNVKINWENIKNSSKKYYKNIKKFNTETDFDFSSVMLNDYFHGSSNGSGPAFVSFFNPFYERQYELFSNFSHNDYRRINELYCSMRCSKSTKCQNGGYYGKTCDTCQCPPGFEGKFCTEMTLNDNTCPVIALFPPTRRKQSIRFRNINGTCRYIIKSKKKRKIGVRVAFLQLNDTRLCNSNTNLEIKYRSDKGTRGLTLCTDISGVEIPAQSSEVLIYFNNFNGGNEMKLDYFEK